MECASPQQVVSFSKAKAPRYRTSCPRGMSASMFPEVFSETLPYPFAPLRAQASAARCPARKMRHPVAVRDAAIRVVEEKSFLSYIDSGSADMVM